MLLEAENSSHLTASQDMGTSVNQEPDSAHVLPEHLQQGALLIPQWGPVRQGRGG